MELLSAREYKDAVVEKNFNNVIDLLVAVGRCKKSLTLSNTTDLKAEKAKMWEETLCRKYEALVEDAKVKFTGFNGNEGSYFYKPNLKNHKIYQITSASYFWTLGLKGKRELSKDIAFDLADNHLPFAVLSVTGGNAIDLMAKANLMATKILERDFT